MQQDPRLAIIAICISALAVLASVGVAVATLIATSQREHQKWMKEQRLAAFYDFLDRVDEFQRVLTRTNGRNLPTLHQLVDTAHDKVQAERIKVVCNAKTVTCAEAVEARILDQIAGQFPYGTTNSTSNAKLVQLTERFQQAVKDLRQAVRDENGVDVTYLSLGERLRGLGKALQGKA